MKKKKMLMVCISLLVTSTIMLMSGVSSFANEDIERKKPIDVVYENPESIGDFIYGNSTSNILAGGKKLDITNTCKFIIRDDGNSKKLEYQYLKGGFLGLFPKIKKIQLIEDATDISNINLLDNPKDKLDDTVYFTNGGVVSYVNVKSLHTGKIEKLKDKNVKMMYLVNKNSLFCMTETEVFKYNIKDETIEHLDVYECASSFIPTQYGNIFFVKSDECVDVVTNNQSIRSCIEKINSANECDNFSLIEIRNEDVFFSIDILGNETDIPKTLNYGIKLTDLFGEITESMFWISYNSEYADVYKYDGSINFNNYKEIYIGNCKLGNSYENISTGGTKLELGRSNSIIINDINMEYNTGNDNSIVLTREKNIKELNIYNKNNEIVVYYTSNGILKKLNLNNGKKSVVEGFSEKIINKVYLVDNSFLYYVEAGIIYSYNLEKNEIIKLDVLKDDYLPTGYGLLHFSSDGEGEPQIWAGNNELISYLKTLVDGEITLEQYVLKKDVIYFEITVTKNNETTEILMYEVNYRDLFKNLDIDDFERIDEDDSYNFVDTYGSLKFTNSKNHYSAGVKLGNKISVLMNKGTELDLGEDGFVSYDGENISYQGSAYDGTVLISSVKNAKNFNIVSTKNKNILYYSVKNKIKSINLITGEKSTLVEDDVDIDFMLVVDNKDILYSIDGVIKSYENGTISEESRCKENDIKGFIPIPNGKFNDKYTYVYVLDNDFVWNGQHANDQLDKIASSWYSSDEYEILHYGTDNEYLYIYISIKEENKVLRIRFDDICGDEFSSAFTEPDKIFDEFTKEGWPLDNYTEFEDFEKLYNSNASEENYYESITNIYTGGIVYKFNDDKYITFENNRFIYSYVDDSYNEEIGSPIKKVILFDYRELYDNLFEKSEEYMDGEINEEINENLDEEHKKLILYISNIVYNNNSLYFIENGSLERLDLLNGTKSNVINKNDMDANGNTHLIQQFYILDNRTIVYLSNEKVYETSIDGGIGNELSETSELVGINSFIATNKGNIYKVTNSEINNIILAAYKEAEEKGMKPVIKFDQGTYISDLFYIGTDNVTSKIIDFVKDKVWDADTFNSIDISKIDSEYVYFSVSYVKGEEFYLKNYRAELDDVFFFKSFSYIEEIIEEIVEE